MPTVTQSAQGSKCSVELTRPGWRIHLVASLGEPFTGGSIVAPLPDAAIALDPADDASKGYALPTWISGLASGALYAFRYLNVPRRRLWLSRLEGHVGSTDMGALASAASLMVARLSGKEPPPVELGEWKLNEGPTGGNGVVPPAE